MTTLLNPPLSTLFKGLFADADATDAALQRQRAGLSDEGRANPDDYRALYSSMKDFHLAVSRETGSMLYVLARAIRARSIVEYGTSFGISTLHLAAALKDNGGGRLIGTEFEPSKVKRARENLTAAGLSDWSRFGKVMQSRPSRTICRIRSISFFSMEPRRFT